MLLLFFSFLFNFIVLGLLIFKTVSFDTEQKQKQEFKFSLLILCLYTIGMTCLILSLWKQTAKNKGPYACIPMNKLFPLLTDAKIN